MERRTGKENGKDIRKNSCRASLTVEAALVLPIFLLAVVSLFDFFIVINYHNIVQQNVFRAAESVVRNTYLLERIQTETTGEQRGKTVQRVTEELATEEEDHRVILTEGINTAFVLQQILSADVRDYTGKAGVYGGIAGISMVGSSLGNTDGINDIKVNYRIRVGGLYGQLIKFANRCYCRAWIGESIRRDSGAVAKGRIVYVTKTGEVYHYKRNCSYIRIVPTGVVFENISDYRNVTKSRYRPCKTCVHGGLQATDTVYITSDGTRYHSDKTCSKIWREVSAVYLSEVGDKRPCSKCGGGH